MRSVPSGVALGHTRDPCPAGALQAQLQMHHWGRKTQVQDRGLLPDGRLLWRSHTSGRQGGRELQGPGNLRWSCRAWAPGFLGIADQRLSLGACLDPRLRPLPSREAWLIQLCVLSLSQPLREGRQSLWAWKTHKRGSVAPAGPWDGGGQARTPGHRGQAGGLGPGFRSGGDNLAQREQGKKPSLGPRAQQSGEHGSLGRDLDFRRMSAASPRLPCMVPHSVGPLASQFWTPGSKLQVTEGPRSL